LISFIKERIFTNSACCLMSTINGKSILAYYYEDGGVDMKGKKFQSLKIILSSIVVLIVILLTAVLVTVSYNAAYQSVESAYLNQLQNFNKDVERQLAAFYEQQVNNAKFLASNRTIVNAAQSGNFDVARGMLTSYFKNIGGLENIFISTAEENTMIVADGKNGKSVGLRWKDTGFNDNISNALRGKIHISNPYKSPATGIPVVLITVPIVEGKRVVGIFGLPFDLGTFSFKMVKDIKIGKTGYPFIMDDKGLTFAHPDKDMILTLDVKEHDWGKQMLASASGTIVRYEWKGKDKILTFVKNDTYRFISASTMYVSDINEDARAMAVIMVILGIICIVFAGISIFIIIVRKLKPLDECKNVMNDMAQGNLTSRYEGKMSGDEISEIAKTMNSSLDQFEELISSIIVASQNLAQAVEQISTGNQSLSQRTSEQASALEEVASTIEEATATIKQNAENAQEANRMSEDSLRLGDDGSAVVNEAVRSINDISESSKKIGDIITVINEIAFQTNLLALNAAVEAARAGDQGRGFAVVAGEVRNLAQRARNEANNIDDLIKNSIEKIEKGSELSNKSGEALVEVIASIQRMNQLISEIAAASEEQRQGIDQINIAVSEMDTMTQQNAALVEETAAASEEMANQAQELLKTMEQFKISKHKTLEIENKRKKVSLHLLDHNGDRESKKTEKNSKMKDGNGNGRGIAGEHKNEIHNVDQLLNDGFEEF